MDFRGGFRRFLFFFFRLEDINKGHVCYECAISILLTDHLIPQIGFGGSLGGAIGSSARWAAGVRFDIPPEDLPWPTLTVNLLGCLLIGFAASRIARDTRAWSFVVTGLLGGFTTMSSSSDEVMLPEREK